MSKLRLLVVMVFSVALIPTLVSAGNGDPTGSCYIENFGDTSADGPLSLPSDAEGFVNVAECIDGWTEAECSLLGGSWDWQEGVSCTARDTPFTWDGSCLVPDSKFGDVCVLLWIDPQEEITSQELCEGQVNGSSQNTWYNDTVCGGAPVPTAPRAAMAMMVLVLLAGSLTLLAFKSSSA